jgi:hypothetical protein
VFEGHNLGKLPVRAWRELTFSSFAINPQYVSARWMKICANRKGPRETGGLSSFSAPSSVSKWAADRRPSAALSPGRWYRRQQHVRGLCRRNPSVDSPSAVPDSLLIEHVGGGHFIEGIRREECRVAFHDVGLRRRRRAIGPVGVVTVATPPPERRGISLRR